MNDIEMSLQHEAERGGGSNVLSLLGSFDPAQSETLLRMEDGRMIRLNTTVLTQAIEQSASAATAQAGRSGELPAIVIPLVEERLRVGKRTIETGKVRLHKWTEEYTQALDEVLAVRTFDVERVVINRHVETAPPVRQEGNVSIYSLVEEQLILTKQLILREEVRIVQRDTERRDTQVVTLHKEHLTVEREPL